MVVGSFDANCLEDMQSYYVLVLIRLYFTIASERLFLLPTTLKILVDSWLKMLSLAVRAQRTSIAMEQYVSGNERP